MRGMQSQGNKEFWSRFLAEVPFLYIRHNAYNFRNAILSAPSPMCWPTGFSPAG